MKTAALIHNVSTDPSGTYRDKVQQILESYGVQVYVAPVASKDCPVVPTEMGKPDIAIVLGGDGTFLRAARCFAADQIPLVGVNTGTLGFLTRIEADRVGVYLKLLADGDFAIEERMMLSVNDPRQGDAAELALNDVVVKNANPSHMCSLRLYLNDTLVAAYDADGIIVSTPTGSTAYSLSAGGPVLSPEVEAVSITPICPHSLSAKPVVIPADKRLRIESAPKNRDVIYSVDGQESGTLKPGVALSVTRAPMPLKIINFGREEDDFYLLLKKKLHWAMNPRWKSLPGA